VVIGEVMSGRWWGHLPDDGRTNDRGMIDQPGEMGRMINWDERRGGGRFPVGVMVWIDTD